jgi:hypothetical protein
VVIATGGGPERKDTVRKKGKAPSPDRRSCLSGNGAWFSEKRFLCERLAVLKGVRAYLLPSSWPCCERPVAGYIL